MAVSKKRDEEWEALIRRASAEVKRLNPHIGQPTSPATDEEYAQILKDAQELEQLWDEIDQHRDSTAPELSAADAVDQDRGQ